MPGIYDSPWLPIFDESSDGVALAAPESWRLVFVNRTLADWLGAPADYDGDWAVEDVFCSEGSRPLNELLDRVLDGTESGVSICGKLKRPAAALLGQFEVRLKRLDADGTPLVAMIVRNVPSGSLNEAAGSGLGRDSLTGLADRSALLARMASLLRGDRAADLQFAVLFIDLDNFKLVNDAHGHLIGDQVLSEVARRLAGCVRTGDLIARFGGDEFVALVENVADMSEIQPVIDRIDAALATPIALPNGEVILSVSVGVAEATAEHRTPEDLLQDADRAMYATKRLPR